MRSAFKVFVVVLMLVGCCRAAEPIRIVCLGDSVTKAERPGVLANQTFCAALERNLNAAGPAVEVVNAGIGGHTTADGLARFDRDVLAKAPQQVVIMFGLNDSWIDEGRTASRVSVDEYRNNLRRMIGMCSDKKIAVTLMTPNPAIAPRYPAERNRTLRPYVDVVREVAAENNLPVIDVYARIAELAVEGTDLNTLFTDAMHPNPAGQTLIADLLTEHFRGRLAAIPAK